MHDAVLLETARGRRTDGLGANGTAILREMRLWGTASPSDYLVVAKDDPATETNLPCSDIVFNWFDELQAKMARSSYGL